MNRPIHQQLVTLIQALQSATMRSDMACLEVLQEKAQQLVEEIKALEERQTTQPLHPDPS